MRQLEWELAVGNSRPIGSPCQRSLASDLRSFADFGKVTVEQVKPFVDHTGAGRPISVFVNEFWTARQRQANALHEISYRACFKPQLPRFFINRLTSPGDLVYDPFMGRGTTLLEAALMGRIPVGCDVNPLSRVFLMPRLRPPSLQAIAQRLETIDWTARVQLEDDLLVFYHAETLQKLCALRQYLLERSESKRGDAVDDWIRMVSLNRLTGHSNGFFSAYTLPPNQAVSVQSQRKINERLKQSPPIRDLIKIILKKSRTLLRDLDDAVRDQLARTEERAMVLTSSCDSTPAISRKSVSLVVTSPPFLNIVDYAMDNWLRCWFLGINAKLVKLTVPRKLEDWKEAMTRVFFELARVLKPEGHIAFEVGEVNRGATLLEEAVVPCGAAAGLEPVLILINDQKFTKTANCWGVDNMSKGTNTNRVVVFRRGKDAE